MPCGSGGDGVPQSGLVGPSNGRTHFKVLKGWRAGIGMMEWVKIGREVVSPRAGIEVGCLRRGVHTLGWQGPLAGGNVGV